MKELSTVRKAMILDLGLTIEQVEKIREENSDLKFQQSLYKIKAQILRSVSEDKDLKYSRALTAKANETRKIWLAKAAKMVAGEFDKGISHLFAISSKGEITSKQRDFFKGYEIEFPIEKPAATAVLPSPAEVKDALKPAGRTRKPKTEKTATGRKKTTVAPVETV